MCPYNICSSCMTLPTKTCFTSEYCGSRCLLGMKRLHAYIGPWTGYSEDILTRFLLCTEYSRTREPRSHCGLYLTTMWLACIPTSVHLHLLQNLINLPSPNTLHALIRASPMHRVLFEKYNGNMMLHRPPRSRHRSVLVWLEMLEEMAV